LTQEDWNEVLYNGMDRTSSWAALYFIALMTFGNYVLFNLLVAILVEGFSTEVLNCDHFYANKFKKANLFNNFKDEPKKPITDRIIEDAINAIREEEELKSRDASNLSDLKNDMRMLEINNESYSKNDGSKF
jgi:hypothetical protein